MVKLTKRQAFLARQGTLFDNPTLDPAATKARGPRGESFGPGEKTPATKEAYVKRALLLIEHAAKQMGVETPMPREVAVRTIARKATLNKRTWWLYKAALIYHFETVDTPDAQAAVELLRNESSKECLAKSNKTSGKRTKRASDSRIADVIEAANETGSQYAHILVLWLEMGAHFGLRPHEWAQASIIDMAPAEFGSDDIWKDEPRPHLQIRNGKNTNGRSHGDFRHLELINFPPDLMDRLKGFLALMQEAHSSGKYQQYYEGVRKLLLRLNQKLSGNEEAQYVQLYSMRHKFSSTAKKAYTLDEVAAMMGHATDATASEHYGKRISATGLPMVRAVGLETARVKKMHRQHPAMRDSKSAKQSSRSASKSGKAQPNLG
jgi:hypothetical protein